MTITPMQIAELEIRQILAEGPAAMSSLYAAYTTKTPTEKAAFVAVLINRVVTTEVIKQHKTNAAA